MKIGLRNIKTAVVAPVALLLATGINLESASSAAIITILTVTNTKRSTAKNRVKSLIFFDACHSDRCCLFFDSRVSSDYFRLISVGIYSVVDPFRVVRRHSGQLRFDHPLPCSGGNACQSDHQ